MQSMVRWNYNSSLSYECLSHNNSWHILGRQIHGATMSRRSMASHQNGYDLARWVVILFQ